MTNRAKIKELLEKMLSGIHPSLLLKEHISIKENKLIVDNESFDLSNADIFIIGCGKAGVSMSETIEKILGLENIKEGLVIAPDISSDTKKIRIVHSTHPFISKKSFLAGKEMVEFLKKIDRKDIVISLLSGGGSALMSYPEERLGFKEKLGFINFLILKGIPEIEVNTVRKAISGVKGGKIAKKLEGTQIINMLLLDNGGDISAIASGPTLIPTDKKTAKQVLKEYGVYDSAPAKIKNIIDKQSKKKNDFTNLKIKNVLIGDNTTAKKSLVKHLTNSGCKNVWMIDEFFYRDIEQATDKLAQYFKGKYESVSEKGLYAVVAGGEIPVKLHKKGKGGRNQHLAAIIIKKLKGLDNFVFVSFATDGRDYLHGVRGAIITNETIKKVKEKNIDVDEYLKTYNTFHLHKKLNTLLEGGLTGTNVSDVYVFMFEK